MMKSNINSPRLSVGVQIHALWEPETTLETCLSVSTKREST